MNIERCKNMVGYSIPHGYTYKYVELPCGNTGPHGDPLTCDDCLKQRGGVPLGYCAHGVRITQYDCDCAKCEMGE